MESIVCDAVTDISALIKKYALRAKEINGQEKEVCNRIILMFKSDINVLSTLSETDKKELDRL